MSFSAKFHRARCSREKETTWAVEKPSDQDHHAISRREDALIYEQRPFRTGRVGSAPRRIIVYADSDQRHITIGQEQPLITSAIPTTIDFVTTAKGRVTSMEEPAKPVSFAKKSEV